MNKGSLAKSPSKAYRIPTRPIFEEYLKKKCGEMPGLVQDEPTPVNHEVNMEMCEAAHERAQKSQEELEIKRYLAEEREKQSRIASEMAKQKAKFEEDKKVAATKPKEVAMEDVPSDVILAPPEEKVEPTPEAAEEKLELSKKYPQAEPSMKGKRVYFTELMANNGIVKQTANKGNKKKAGK